MSIRYASPETELIRVPLRRQVLAGIVDFTLLVGVAAAVAVALAAIDLAVLVIRGRRLTDDVFGVALVEDWPSR